MLELNPHKTENESCLNQDTVIYCQGCTRKFNMRNKQNKYHISLLLCFITSLYIAYNPKYFFLTRSDKLQFESKGWGSHSLLCVFYLFTLFSCINWLHEH